MKNKPLKIFFPVLIIFVISLLFLWIPLKETIKKTPFRPLLNRDMDKIYVAFEALREANNEKYQIFDYNLPRLNKTFLTKGEFDKFQNALLKELGLVYQDKLIKGAIDTFCISNKGEFLKFIFKNERNVFYLPDDFISTNYFIIRNISNNPIKDARFVVNDKDWTSIEGVVNSALKDAASDKEKALYLCTFLKDNLKHFSPPDNGIYMHDPLRLLNVFGYGICDDVAESFVILANKAGLKARKWGLNGHVTSEVFFENSWHMLDPDQGIFYLKSDNKNIASVSEISKNPEKLIGRTYEPKFNNKERFIRVYKSTYDNSIKKLSQSSAPITQPIKFSFLPKEEIVFYYNKKDCWFMKDSWFEPPYHTIGLDRLYLLDKDAFSLLKKSELEYIDGSLISNGENSYLEWEHNLSYPILDVIINIKHSGNNDDIKLSLSIDKKDWVLCKNLNPFNSEISLRRFISNFTAQPSNKYFFRLFLKKGIRIFKLTSEAKFQIFPFSMFAFKKGENNFEIRAKESCNLEAVFNYELNAVLSKERLEEKDVAFPLPGQELSGEQLKSISLNDKTENLGYQLMLSDDKKCKFPLSPNFLRNFENGQFYFTENDITFFNKGQSYYWKVRRRYKESEWSPWSDVFEFKISKD